MKITGKVITTIFHNESNGYTIMIVKTGKQHITAVGETMEIETGDEVELEGIYDVHKIYGDQFKFSTCSKIMPKDKTALIQYISDNVKGIGKKTARNIVDRFGDMTVETIRMSPDKLSEVSGLNEEKIERIQRFFIEQWEKWNTVEYLSKFNISVIVANKIYENLKGDTIKIVKEDPYSLLEFVKTLDFKTIDTIGLNQGISKENSSRVCSRNIIFFIRSYRFWTYLYRRRYFN